MRGDWLNAAGKERPHVPASGDVPFLPAVWDSPLWPDDSYRALPSRDQSVRVCAHLPAWNCVNVRLYAPLMVE